MVDASTTWGVNSVSDVERIVVEDLAPGADMLLRAKQAPGVPTPGLPHDLLAGCKVESVTARPLSTTSAELIVTSRTPESLEQPPVGSGAGWVVSNDVSLVQVSTQIDRDGAPIQTVYLPKGDGRALTDTATVSYYMPMRTLTASAVRTKLVPDQWYHATGKVNDRFWESGDRGYWLFMGVKDSTRDGGRTYSVQLTFLYNPESWATVAVYKDPNGQIGDNILPADTARVKDGKYEAFRGNGIERRLLYKEADFASIFDLGRR